MRARRFVLVVVLAGCAPSTGGEAMSVAPEDAEQRLPFASVDRLFESLPKSGAGAAAHALERRALRLTANCERSHVARAGTTVAIDAGVGCTSIRGSVTVTFTERRAELSLRAVFDHWSIGDGDVLDGEWRTGMHASVAGAESEGPPFADETAADPSLRTPWPLAESAVERCIDQFMQRARLIAKGASAMPAFSLAGLPLMALAAVHTATTCR